MNQNFLKSLRNILIDHFQSNIKDIKNSRKNDSFYELLLRLDTKPKEYLYLNTLQLLKHIFGIKFNNEKNIKLLYLYWLPNNYNEYQEYIRHEEEVNKLKEDLEKCKIDFEVLTYQKLWNSWELSNNTFIKKHIENLRKKYDIEI